MSTRLGVRIAQPALTAVLEHLRACAPHEGVGLLAGPAAHDPIEGEPYGALLDHWVQLDNVAEFPRFTYEVAPVQLLAAHEELEADGRYPWVVVHSHPDTTTAPSTADLEYARNPRQLHLIVSLAGLHPAMSLWRLDPAAERFPGASVIIVPDLAGRDRFVSIEREESAT